MVQAIVNLGEREDRLLTIVKGKFGLKNKSDAVNFVIGKYEEELLEPELRPEYVQKIRNIEKKGKFTSYKNLSELRKEIENA
ncbi:MAG: DUF2683 family protein [Candidatus Woesearchaeota archaeon]|jgi:hypothetical protein|nr:DUF2683 family protein [Candidatus Woesearchaeota archaeon]PIU30462.1 MAG: antitoxin [Candidatus Woesearchaeota archaeon CG07_land_8_20_14_0_80_44_23]